MMTARFAPHFQQCHDIFVLMMGDTAFANQYPEIVALKNGPAASGTQAEIAPLAVFEAITAKIARSRNGEDLHLLNASKRDLHHLPLRPENVFVGDGGARDARLMAVVSDRFGKDFVNANYLGHLSTNFRYLYVATPKVGFTKLKKLLFEAEWGHPLDDGFSLHDPAFSPLLEPIDDVDLLDIALGSPDWFRFGFVRNPYIRLISCYVHKIVNSAEQRSNLLPVLGLPADAPVPGFADFVHRVAAQDDPSRDIHWASQYHLLRPDLVDYGFIGRMERMSEDLGHVCQRLSISPFDPLDRKVNRAGGIESAQGYYDEPLRRLVARSFARDFESFGYDPDVIP